MEFCFFRARRPVVATSALALALTGLAGSSIATAQAANAQQGQAQGQGAAPGQKNYKDRGEYDLYSQVTQTQDPKARLQLLNTWQDKYPQTDFQQERLQYFVATLGQLAQSDPSQRQPLIDKAEQLLKADPKNFTANYYVTLWGPAVGGANPSPDLENEIDAAAHGVLDNADAAFPASKKPANMSDADWTKAKNAVLALAHNGLAYDANAKKDAATAENEYKASLAANPGQGAITAAYAKLLYDDKKVPEALFEYAHAAQYDGPGAVPAPDRQKLMDFFKNAYNGYHGGPDGADQVLAQAKDNASPPPGFTITSASDIANKQADVLNQRIQSDPAFKIWYAVKQSLQDKGDAFFNSDIKDAEIPGGADNVTAFSGTVISLDPPDHPTKVVVGVEDPTKPDATLVFSQPLPTEALDKIKVGQPVQFSGVADSYVKDPYMLTFKDPTIPGVKTAAPAKTGTRRRRR